jgi:sialic acid synthase SpsE
MFARYVSDVRAVSRACAPCENKVHGVEATVKQRARRSIYAARDLQAGEVLTESDLLVVRPEAMLAPNDIDELLGRPLTGPIARYAPVTFDAIENRSDAGDARAREGQATCMAGGRV